MNSNDNHKGFWVSPSNLFTLLLEYLEREQFGGIEGWKEIEHWVVVDGYKITSAINSKDKKWCLINIDDYMVEGKQWHLIGVKVQHATSVNFVIAVFYTMQTWSFASNDTKTGIIDHDINLHSIYAISYSKIYSAFSL